MDPARDITVIENTPIDYLDFASPVSGLGSKIGLDATDKFPGETNREWGRQIRMDQAVIDKVALSGERPRLQDRTGRDGQMARRVQPRMGPPDPHGPGRGRQGRRRCGARSACRAAERRSGADVEGGPTMTALLPAELAWYATGRFYKAEDGSLADYGYFLHLPFLDVPLFDGKRGETQRALHLRRPAVQGSEPVQNGGLSLGIDPVGEFSLYLQRNPPAISTTPLVCQRRMHRHLPPHQPGGRHHGRTSAPGPPARRPVR